MLYKPHGDHWAVHREVTPHYYQADAYPAIEKAWSYGHRKILLVIPTGGGKTICCGEMIARRVERKQRVLVLAHTRKLVTQFRESLEHAYGLHVGLEMGEREHSDEPVVCATFQTMLGRVAKGKFNEDDFDLIIIDEAHRALGEGYARLSGHFKNADFIGLTATPRRSDQKDLMKFFDFKAVDVPLDKLIREGFLAPLTIINCPVEIKLEAKSKTGDLTEEEVAHAIDPYLAPCAQQLKLHGAGRCSLVFLPLIEISKKFTNILKAIGVRAEHVDGTMKDSDVKSIQQKLEVGDLEVVCNSMLWTEGIDVRPVNCIMNLRPTKSWTLFCQVIGRATRTFDPAKHGIGGTRWPVKQDAVILDPIWLCSDHNPIKRPACLLAKDDEDERAITEKLRDGGSLMEATDAVSTERENALRERLARMANRKSKLVNAMEFFLGQGNLDMAEYEPQARWQERDITPGQRAVLNGQGVDIHSVKDFGHASAIIGNILKRRIEGFAEPLKCKEAITMGMADAFTRKKADVWAYVTAAKTKGRSI